MAISIGQKLKEAREAQNLTFEDIAHETRIPIQSLRHLEEDDYSHFPSQSYAKSFLRNYSNFLEVDASEVLEAMSAPGNQSLGSPDFLKSSLDFSGATIPVVKQGHQEKQGMPIFMLVLLIALTFLFPTIYFLGKRQGPEPLDPAKAAAVSENLEKEAVEDTPENKKPPKIQTAQAPPSSNRDAELDAVIGISPPEPDESRAGNQDPKKRSGNNP